MKEPKRFVARAQSLRHLQRQKARVLRFPLFNRADGFLTKAMVGATWLHLVSDSAADSLMIVTPYREDPFLSPRSFDEFFSTIEATLLNVIHAKTGTRSISAKLDGVAHGAPVISLSLPLYDVDPLTALEAIATPDQEHFYWENRHTQEAIAAIGSTTQIQLTGSDRLVQAKRFISQCLSQIVVIGDLDCPFAGARFFCRFTFFDDAEPQAMFPPASLVLPQWQVSSRGEFGSFVVNLALTPTIDLRNACIHIWETYNLLRFRLVNGASNRGYTPAPARPLHRQGNHHPGNHHPGNHHPGNHQKSEGRHLFTPLMNRLPQIAPHERRQFKRSVAAILDAVEHTELNKAVLAHRLDVQLPQPLDIPRSLQTLRQIHPDCYLFSTQNERGQTFLGASPERLLSIRQGQLTTEAIAGSASRGMTPAQDAYYANRLLCSLKELHEHQLVVDFISHQLEHLGLDTQRSPFPCLLQLSNIQHLQTPIYATIPPDLHALDVVAALHPTPAVAGVPRQLACDYIRRYESFERSLYAAPFGWIDYQGNSEFVVAIRSALLDGTQAYLYAGAGIVHGSNPAHELSEIELKLRALYSALIQPDAYPSDHELSR